MTKSPDLNRRDLIAMAVAFGGCLALQAPRPAAAQPARRFAVAAPLVDFCAIDAERRLVSTADWRGQVLFVHWFGAWCPPCRKEIPELAELAQQFAGRADVRFVFLNGLERVGVTAKWLASIGTSIPLYDSTHTSRQEQFTSVLTGERRHNFRDLGLTVYPSSWLVDKRGFVKKGWINGQVGWPRWGRAFVEELAAEAVPAPDTGGADWLAGTWSGEIDGHGARSLQIERGPGGTFHARWGGAGGRARPVEILWSNADEALLGSTQDWRASGNGLRVLASASGEAAGTFMVGKERELARVWLKRAAA